MSALAEYMEREQYRRPHLTLVPEIEPEEKPYGVFQYTGTSDPHVWDREDTGHRFDEWDDADALADDLTTGVQVGERIFFNAEEVDW